MFFDVLVAFTSPRDFINTCKKKKAPLPPKKNKTRKAVVIKSTVELLENIEVKSLLMERKQFTELSIRL